MDVTPPTSVEAALGHHFGQLSLLHGWLPVAMQLSTAVVLLMAIGWRSRRWRTTWLPATLAFGAVFVALAHWYIGSIGVAGDPAPRSLWAWLAATGVAVAVSVLGWRGARWWRRGLSITAVPLCLLSAALAVNLWVGYFPTLHAAWNQLTAGPLPDETDRIAVTAMQVTGKRPAKGVVVPVAISGASKFKHRRELVYLPPVFFAHKPRPRLPAVIMIGAQMNTPADWLRAGNAITTIDDFAAAHRGNAPVFVFADPSGAFNNDTECVNGSRGNAADHLTNDIVPFMISNFGVSNDPAKWGVVGWSMGGTCALDLTTMHPELFSAFVDIAGDAGPNSGNRAETIASLFGGDERAWAAYDPKTVINRHRTYNGIAGWFAVAHGAGSFAGKVANPENQDVAARTLCALGSAKGIRCAVIGEPGRHDWPFAARAFADALPWLAGRLSTPGVVGRPLPGFAPVLNPSHVGRAITPPVAGG